MTVVDDSEMRHKQSQRTLRPDSDVAPRQVGIPPCEEAAILRSFLIALWREVPPSADRGFRKETATVCPLSPAASWPSVVATLNAAELVTMSVADSFLLALEA